MLGAIMLGPRLRNIRSACAKSLSRHLLFGLERRRSSPVLAHDRTVNLGPSPAANGRSEWSPAETAGCQMSDFDRGRGKNAFAEDGGPTSIVPTAILGRRLPEREREGPHTCLYPGGQRMSRIAPIVDLPRPRFTMQREAVIKAAFKSAGKSRFPDPEKTV